MHVLGTGRRRRAAPAVALLATLLLASCAAQRSPIAEARNTYMKSSAPPVEGTQTRIQGAAIGAAVGAVLGAIAGAAVGGNAAGLGAAIGGGIGTAAGLAYAEGVVRRRQDYANASAYLAARAEALNSQIEAARQVNESLDRDLGELRADRQKLDAAIEDADEVLQRMRSNIASENEALVQTQSEGLPSDAVAEQLQRIGRLQAEEVRLARHLEELTDHRDGGTIVVEPSSHQ